jgi:flagellar basal-body rod protein FlgF
VDSTTAVLASGLRARAEALDILANNLANTTTTGFKFEVEMYSPYASEEAVEGNKGSEFSPQSPDLTRTWTRFTQGTLSKSERPLDFAVEGPGFFGIETREGMLLTRDGRFQIGSDGRLRTSDGNAVKLKPLIATDGKLPPQFDPKLPLSLDSTGILRQNGRAIASFELFESDPAQLSRKGANFFSLSDSAAMKASVGSKTHQGFLEQSNADPAEASIRMVQTLRQFEMLQKAVQLQGEMGRRSTEEVGRV